MGYLNRILPLDYLKLFWTVKMLLKNLASKDLSFDRYHVLQSYQLKPIKL